MARAKKATEAPTDPLDAMLAIAALRHPRPARQSARRGVAREPVGA